MSLTSFKYYTRLAAERWYKLEDKFDQINILFETNILFLDEFKKHNKISINKFMSWRDRFFQKLMVDLAFAYLIKTIEDAIKIF